MSSSRQFKRRHIFVFVLALISWLSFACSPNKGGGNLPGGGSSRLQGAGSTFVNPLMQKWLYEYSKVNPNARIDYQSIGSGGGIKQFQARTVDFGATDIPMTEGELRNSPGEVLHIPIVLGAVVITYNVPSITEPLRFSPDVLTDIFLGKITRWNDPRIAADNPGANLPDAPITVVHRSDGSGTSAVFTDYLSKVSPEWKEKVGADKSPRFPTGLGAKGNEGVTGQIRNTPNTIGYVERAYAVQNKMPIALIKNRAGNFVAATPEAITAAAAESVPTTPDDMRVSITDAAGANAYPISSYVYALVAKEQQNAAKGKALIDFIWWGVHDGEAFAEGLQYAPLPAEIVSRVEAKLNSVIANGRTLRS